MVNDQIIVRVCTFNIRHESLDHGTPNEWKKRRPIMKKCLERMQPMVIGVQEGDPGQLNDILEDLNESSKIWSWLGEATNELKITNAIFYRHDLFSLISTSIFWFNEHPAQAGVAWNAQSGRACTRAHFEHKQTHQPYIIYNLHIDFPSQNARQHSILVLLQQIQQNGDHIDRIIVIGDFNNWPEEVEGETPADELTLLGQKAPEILQMKQAGFVDTYQHDETPTFNGFRSTGYGPKIDFIWISSNSIYRVAGETKVDDYHDEHGLFPSDHFPVYSDLTLCTIIY